MKILLLGRNGQVGWELARALALLGDVVALDRQGADGLTGDLEHLDGLRRTVRKVRPDLIANAAAYTNVDGAEADPDLAQRVNAEAPAVLGAEAAHHGAFLVHFSTDYVFDGSGSAAWREEDNPAPLNVYGASKLSGEEAVRRTGCRHLIFRTQWIYAARGQNFLRKILLLSTKRDDLSVVADQFGAPTGAELVADVVAYALRHALSRGGPIGTYHLTAGGETSWHGYARFVIAEARRLGWPVQMDDTAVRPVATADFPTPAARPRNSRLDLTRLQQTFDLRLPAWQTGVLRTVGECVSACREMDGRPE